jgi:hypothetical protein
MKNYEWKPGTTGSYSDPANWILQDKGTPANKAPGAGDNLLFAPGNTGTNNIVTTSSEVHAANVSVELGVGLQLQGDPGDAAGYNFESLSISGSDNGGDPVSVFTNAPNSSVPQATTFSADNVVIGKGSDLAITTPDSGVDRIGNLYNANDPNNGVGGEGFVVGMGNGSIPEILPDDNLVIGTRAFLHTGLFSLGESDVTVGNTTTVDFGTLITSTSNTTFSPLQPIDFSIYNPTQHTETGTLSVEGNALATDLTPGAVSIAPGQSAHVATLFASNGNFNPPFGAGMHTETIDFNSTAPGHALLDRLVFTYNMRVEA